MKLTLPAFPKVSRKKKLRATAARRGVVADAEFEEMGEPNMKLSRALLIVLVLHVVAVSGIIAFNALKSRQGPTVSATPVRSPAALNTSSATPTPSVAPVLAHEAKARSSTLPLKTENRSKPSATSAERGRSYTVAKGDTPVTIARKFKVPFDDLLAANHITDPRKLKIGQKLIIPVKTTKTKKNGE